MYGLAVNLSFPTQTDLKNNDKKIHINFTLPFFVIKLY